MKKKMLGIALALTLSCSMLAGCGEAETPSTGGVISSPIIPETEGETPVVDDTIVEDVLPEIPELVIPDGYVANELTGLPIAKELENQRPIAVMVDNEVTALDHFGINEADIVFEMMNSTLNGRVTRLMCLVKDWGAIKQFGSVRSARVTNCILASEWNAILCHDGGPYPISDFSDRLNRADVDHLSGVFSRVDNGKAREFTEYICPGDLQKYVGSGKEISAEYNKYYTGPHFTFVAGDSLSYNKYSKTMDAKSSIKLPFEHNSSELKYNATTNKYEYYEYGRAHNDGATGEILSFDNLIIQKADFHEYGEGYLMYYVSSPGNDGYYIVDGKAVPITWNKVTDISKENENTNFLDADGKPITLKAGKTYIAIVPSDVWEELVIK